ncbi:hypothetical protein NKG94_07350 [Micromonospora sp. M12]
MKGRANGATLHTARERPTVGAGFPERENRACTSALLEGETAMLVGGYLGAVLIGALIGLLGRLILPGRQRIGLFATFVIGVGSAVLGTVVARALDIDDGASVKVWVLRWDWVVLAIQVGLAIIAVALANMLTFTRLAGGDETPSAGPSPTGQGLTRSASPRSQLGDDHPGGLGEEGIVGAGVLPVAAG